MGSLMIRQDITRIAQGNIQLVLVKMLDKIEALEKAMDALNAAPEVSHGPDAEVSERFDKLITEDDLLMEAEEKVRPLDEEKK